MTGAEERRSVALLATAGFMSAAAIRVCDPMLPALAREFATTPGHAAQTITAYALAYGLLQFFYGPLGDHLGKFRVVVVATLACALGSAGAAVAGSLDALVAWRAVSGATGAGIIALALAWIGDAVPYERRQATIARFLTGSILGMAGGQLLGGIFTDAVGWRGAFVFLACGYIWVGSLLLAELRRIGATHTRTELTMSRGARPRIWQQTRSVAAIGWARIILAAVCLEAVLFFGAVAYIPSYLHARFGLSLAAAGAIGGAYGIGGLAYTLVARRLIAGLGEVRLAAGGGLALSASFAILLLATRWEWTLFATCTLGFGFYMLHNTLQTHATQMAPRARGTAVSLFAAAMYLAQSTGIALASTLVDRNGTAVLFAIATLGLPLVGLGIARLLVLRAERIQDRES